MNKQNSTRIIVSNSICQNQFPNSRALLTGAMLLGLAVCPAWAGITLTTLVSFNGTNGSSPSSLIKASDGNFYGTTKIGGTNGNLGTVFELTSGGVLKSLISFNNSNGAFPVGLTQGADGNFYGTTLQGGSNSVGTVFKVATNGALSTLIHFNGTNGSFPSVGLVQSAADGSFYGTTLSGGTNGNNGTVFQLTTNGAFKTLLSFNETNGSNPYGMLTFGADGNLYGTTYFGGTNADSGTVYRISTNGAFSNLLSFNTTTMGANPYAGLTAAADGSLYGTTSEAGSNGFGGIFKVTTNGAITVISAFKNTDGATPYGVLTQTADGSFYGSTLYGGSISNNGTLFKLSTNNTVGTLYSFGTNNSATGANPYTGLVQASSTTFYGTTLAGGTNGANGTVFVLSLASAPPPPITLTVALDPNGTLVDLNWNTQAQATYQLQATTNSTLVNWTNFGGAITATQTTTTRTDALSAAGQKFYRVMLVTP